MTVVIPYIAPSDGLTVPVGMLWAGAAFIVLEVGLMIAYGLDPSYRRGCWYERVGMGLCVVSGLGLLLAFGWRACCT